MTGGDGVRVTVKWTNTAMPFLFAVFIVLVIVFFMMNEGEPSDYKGSDMNLTVTVAGYELNIYYLTSIHARSIN